MKRIFIITGSVLFITITLGMMLFHEQGYGLAHSKGTNADRRVQVSDIKNEISDLYLPLMLKNFEQELNKPTLEIQTKSALPGEEVDIAIAYTSYGHDISSMVFSIDFDESKLTFNPTPGSVVFNLPTDIPGNYEYDSDDTDGEIDIVIFDPAVPLVRIPDNAIVTITFSVRTGASGEAFVYFSKDPNPSFGNLEGQSVSGEANDGSVQIK